MSWMLDAQGGYRFFHKVKLHSISCICAEGMLGSQDCCAAQWLVHCASSLGLLLGASAF
jgi:hypothetical protein